MKVLSITVESSETTTQYIYAFSLVHFISTESKQRTGTYSKFFQVGVKGPMVYNKEYSYRMFI